MLIYVVDHFNVCKVKFKKKIYILHYRKRLF